MHYCSIVQLRHTKICYTIGSLRLFSKQIIISYLGNYIDHDQVRLESWHGCIPRSSKCSNTFSCGHCHTASHSTTPGLMNRARRWWYAAVALPKICVIGPTIFYFELEGCWRGENIPGLIFFIFVFSIQLTVYVQHTFFAYDRIRTAHLWNRKRPVYQPGPNHCPITFTKPINAILLYLGVGSPGLVILGGNSCSKGREFESQHHILDGHFSHNCLL